MASASGEGVFNSRRRHGRGHPRPSYRRPPIAASPSIPQSPPASSFPTPQPNTHLPLTAFSTSRRRVSDSVAGGSAASAASTSCPTARHNLRTACGLCRVCVCVRKHHRVAHFPQIAFCSCHALPCFYRCVASLGAHRTTPTNQPQPHQPPLTTNLQPTSNPL